jgi:hypothetical protein
MFNDATHSLHALREIIARGGTRAAINGELQALTGIENFFYDDDFAVPTLIAPQKTREWGDFQTPPALARQICQLLKTQGIAPAVIIEPTFGVGNFLNAAMETFAAPLIYGVEIQTRYVWHFKMARFAAALRGESVQARLQLHHDCIFSHQFSREVLDAENILILGNPPWVTSAELSVLESENLPHKRNLKALNGLAALTGKSNFDLNESILLRLMELFGTRRGALALLCKNSVIKNWVDLLPRLPYRVQEIQSLEIDAQKHFCAAVAASLLFVRFGGASRALQCRVASLDETLANSRVFGWHEGKFVSDVERYRRRAALDGECPFVWRQGIKHDCAAVMELQVKEGNLINGDGEKVCVERDFVFPLLKSSDLRAVKAPLPRRAVIVPQRRINGDTHQLRHTAPALWAYLSRHGTALDARKSSIYRGKAPFSIFGVGDYSFKAFKVAISGLYKKPRFTFIESVNGQPVMLDDTCYFLGFDDRQTALLVTFLLNALPMQELLESLAFTDAKRPFTKELLSRLDLRAAFRQHLPDEFTRFWHEQGEVVDESAFNERQLLANAANEQLVLI